VCPRTTTCLPSPARTGHVSTYRTSRHTIPTCSTPNESPPYVSIRQHTSAYVSIRQHTSAYVSIRVVAIATHQRPLAAQISHRMAFVPEASFSPSLVWRHGLVQARTPCFLILLYYYIRAIVLLRVCPHTSDVGCIIHTYICVYMYICTYMYIYINICIHNIHTYIAYMYIYVYICIYIHT
jgi:hypothetical protein